MADTLTCRATRWGLCGALLWSLSIGPGLRAYADDHGGDPQPARIRRTNGPVKVLQRAKLGNYIEDIDFVPNGRFANHIIMTAGFDVYGVPANAHSDHAVRKLFDLRRLGIAVASKGIAYIASERRFAVVNGLQNTTLFICDETGTPLPPRTIQYLGGYFPGFLEGLAYLPPASPLFPDHLIMVATEDFIDFRLEVIRRDGQVVAEIPVPESIAFNGVFGVAFAAPDHLLVGTASGEIWTLDFAGNIVNGPVLTDLAAEGLVQIADGRIVASGGAQLHFFDAALGRLPRYDRDVSTEAHLVYPFSVSWNSNTHQYLVAAETEESGGDPATARVAAVPTSLDSATPIVDFSDFPTYLRRTKSTYLPDEDLIAVGLSRRVPLPPEIVLYDGHGTLVERINLTAIGSPNRVTFIPSTHEFAVKTSASLRKLRILTRAGVLVRDIDFLPSGITDIATATYFNPSHPSGGQFLVFNTSVLGDPPRAVITDFNGNLMSEFDYREALGLVLPTGVSAITTGPQAGAFVAVDGEGSDIVVFRLRTSGDDCHDHDDCEGSQPE